MLKRGSTPIGKAALTATRGLRAPGNQKGHCRRDRHHAGGHTGSGGGLPAGSIHRAAESAGSRAHRPARHLAGGEPDPPHHHGLDRARPRRRPVLRSGRSAGAERQPVQHHPDQGIVGGRPRRRHAVHQFRSARRRARDPVERGLRVRRQYVPRRRPHAGAARAVRSDPPHGPRRGERSRRPDPIGAVSPPGLQYGRPVAGPYHDRHPFRHADRGERCKPGEGAGAERPHRRERAVRALRPALDRVDVAPEPRGVVSRRPQLRIDRQRRLRHRPPDPGDAGILARARRSDRRAAPRARSGRAHPLLSAHPGHHQRAAGGRRGVAALAQGGRLDHAARRLRSVARVRAA